MESYNAKLLDGRRRKFPTDMLVGAEEVLARLYHEHTKSKLYTPLSLGEILSRRTFTPDKAMKPLRAANAASGVQALCLDRGELVASSEPEWTPRSMIAIMDGARRQVGLHLGEHRDRGERRAVRRVVQGSQVAA